MNEAKRLSQDLPIWTARFLPQARLFWSDKGEGPHPDVAASRVALQSAQDFYQALGQPVPRFSLSHGGGVGIVMTAEPNSKIPGVDVEPARTISPRMARLFATEKELSFGLNPLFIWSIKEAVFKSDPDNAGCTVQIYEIESVDLEQCRGTVRRTDSETRNYFFQAGWWRDCALALAYSEAR